MGFNPYSIPSYALDGNVLFLLFCSIGCYNFCKFFNTFVIVVLLGFYGTSLFTSTKHFIEKNEQQNQDNFILRVIDEISEHPLTYTIIFNVFSVLYAVTSTMAIYAAIKLQKMYLIPYMWSQFVQFLISLGIHVFGMIILKKIVNLGILIGITLAGGFYILYIGYSWAGAVALFQIIILINSPKYKILYGDDPMTPRLRNIGSFENGNNIIKSEFTRKRVVDEQPTWQYGGKIISVIPLEQQDQDDVELIHLNNWHWNELVGVKKNFK